MSYKLTSFDGLAFSSQSMDISAGSVAAPLIRLPGGRVFDAVGTDTARVPSALFTAHALLESATPATLQSLFDALQAKRGKSGLLTRLGDGGTSETATARLLSSSASRVPAHIKFLPITLVFQVTSWPWLGTVHTNVAMTKATVTLTRYVTNLTYGGNVSNDVRQIVVTPAASTTMTVFNIYIKQQGGGTPSAAQLLQWNGTLLPTKQLVIYPQSRLVYNDGVASYAGITAPTASEAWSTVQPPLPAADYATAFTGGTGVDVQVTYADGWG